MSIVRNTAGGYLFVVGMDQNQGSRKNEADRRVIHREVFFRSERRIRWEHRPRGVGASIADWNQWVVVTLVRVW